MRRLNLDEKFFDSAARIQYDPQLDSNAHALIGVSPFNSYFSVENMATIFRWAKENFENFQVCIPDELSKYNLMALGYPEAIALRKTRKQDRHLYNRVAKAFESLGLGTKELEKKIIFLSQISNTDRYREQYNECVQLFERKTEFRNDCLAAAETVLSGRADYVVQSSLVLAVNYILAELPLWFNTPYILNLPSSVLVYKDLSCSWYKLCYNHGLASSEQKILIQSIEA